MASRYRGREVIPDWRHYSPARIIPTRHRSLREKKHKKDNDIDRPHTIDVIGTGPETTICGHIDLLYLLPLHNGMHRKLLETFRDKPGNYEGKYNSGGKSKANVVDYGNGYLAISFNDDITRPEMSDFLLARNWRMLNAHCTVQDGKDVIYEKWTNVQDGKAERAVTSKRPRSHSMPRRYY